MHIEQILPGEIFNSQSSYTEHFEKEEHQKELFIQKFAQIISAQKKMEKE